MPTLQELRKAKYPTIKSFAIAANIAPSLAGQWLRGRDDIDPLPLIALLGITKEEYLEAWQATKIEEEAKWKAKHPPMSPEDIEASWKATVDAVYAKMSPEQKQRLRGNQRET